MKPFDIIEKALIHGEWISSEKTLTVLNPSTQQKIGTIPNLSEEATREAINAADTAFKKWSETSPLERANLLLKWHALILQNKEALARLICLENGKPLEEARNEVEYGATFIRWFAEEARRVDGDIIPSDQASRRNLVIKQAVGVVGAITPWNFPIAMITRKCAPAFAAGCTIVLKPSELTPYSALALGKLALDAGFPKGVFNLVTGDAAPIGETLCNDARVRKISFTGSTRVGQLLMQQSAETAKRLSLELGGNAPAIVFEDANLEKAIAGVMASKFRNSGQTCVCANRILVHKNILPEFTARLVKAVAQLKVGDALRDENTHIGPLINQTGFDKVQRLVKDALDKGAKCLIGGKPSSLGGFFYEPTVLIDATKDMAIFHEEIFGPVVALYAFENDGEAIAVANDTRFGLAAYLFTENAQRIWKAFEQVQAGMIAVNTGVFSNATTPFGGIKYSGFGREGSKYGMEEFLQTKCMCWDIG